MGKTQEARAFLSSFWEMPDERSRTKKRLRRDFSIGAMKQGDKLRNKWFSAYKHFTKRAFLGNTSEKFLNMFFFFYSFFRERNTIPVRVTKRSLSIQFYLVAKK